MTWDEIWPEYDGFPFVIKSGNSAWASRNAFISFDQELYLKKL